MQGLIDCPWCSPCSEHDPDEADVRGVMLAERAVIEAAKAWLHSASPRDERDHVYCRHRLGEAIETLEAAEGEE